MKKCLSVLIIILMFITMITPVNAASGSVSASVSTSSPVVGNKVKLTITLKSSKGVGGGIIYVSYDTNYFSKIAFTNSSYGTFSSKTNKIVVRGSSKTSVTFTLTLTTKKVGKSNIEVVTSEFINYDGDDITGYSENIKKTINIKSSSSNNTDNTVTLSQDATISSLKVSNLDLEEDFDSAVYEYKCYAPKGTQTIDITAKPSSSKAKISKINNTLSEGWNKVNIECVAESGKKKTYTINVYVEETPDVYFDENRLGVVKNLDKVKCYEGYEKNQTDNNLTLYSHGLIDLIYLVDEEGSKNFYLYDKNTNSIEGIYNPILIDGKIYLQTNFSYEDFSYLDNDFDKCEYDLNGVKLNSWNYKATNMNEYRLVYLKDNEGQNCLYSYDSVKNTLQRYTMPIIEVEENNDRLYMALSLSGGAAGFMAFIASLFIAGKNNKKKNKA